MTAHWLREHAHPLRTIDPCDDDVADLEPLRDIVGDARVVAVGEGTHRIHEFYQLRHRLTRFLVTEMGFTALVMESGFPEGLRVGDWVRGGYGDLAERLQAQQVAYTARTDPERFALAQRCAVTARHADAFLQAMAAGPERTYDGANIRDAAMAENVEWILGREERVVVAAANGHVQRWPFSMPLMTNPMTTLGEHLAAALGERMVVIGSGFVGGRLFLHRPIPGGPPGHTEVFTEDLTTLDPTSLDALLATAGIPRYLLDLRSVPASGPIAERFAAVTSIMTGMQATPVNPTAAFDAMVYVDHVTPWHTSLAY